ncbi:MAG: hypothetical protein ICV60_17205 [Pyrinomonadaceae bacterium]|nr:hypothetical protein [Pyrinomonadaceae bacterium]
MTNDVNKNRLQPKTTEAQTTEQLEPVIENTPPLPVIDWSLINQQAPVLLDTPYDYLPEADVVIITWAGAEWAAMEHVFCTSDTTMPYSDRSTSYWDGWQKYDKDMPTYSGSSDDDWDYWGYYRLVQIQDKNVLLFKSNTHLDWPGEQYLEDLIYRFIDYVKPQLIISTGTAGGARPQDQEGTVNVVQAGTLYVEGKPPSDWPNYTNDWQANWSIIKQGNFTQLLFPIPTTKSDLESLSNQFNQYYGTDYSLSELNALNLDMGASLPQLNDMTPDGTALLTTDTFVVATTSGDYADFACVEMDDAIIGKVCSSQNTSFGFVRNISDPIQNANLPSEVQGNWGSVIYDAYGFYTSYNSALAAWAIVTAQLQ